MFNPALDISPASAQLLMSWECPKRHTLFTNSKTDAHACKRRLTFGCTARVCSRTASAPAAAILFTCYAISGCWLFPAMSNPPTSDTNAVSYDQRRCAFRRPSVQSSYGNYIYNYTRRVRKCCDVFFDLTFGIRISRMRSTEMELSVH